MFLPQIKRLSGLLLRDGDDMVQKGLGWLLRETAKYDAARTVPYLLEFGDAARAWSCGRRAKPCRLGPQEDPGRVSGLTLFGLLAVTAMLVCYALEHRHRAFILAFAVACALGSIYGFLQGAWPFGLVEADLVAGVGPKMVAHPAGQLADQARRFAQKLRLVYNRGFR